MADNPNSDNQNKRQGDRPPPKEQSGERVIKERGYPSSTQPPTGKPPSEPGPGADAAPSDSDSSNDGGDS